MRLTQTLAFIAAVAAILAAIFSYSETSEIKPFLRGSGSWELGVPRVPGGGELGILGHVGDSPIMASGGSMSFRDLNGWSCSTSSGITTCISKSQINASAFAAEGLIRPSSPTDPIPAGWENLNVQWQIDFYARDMNGNPATSSGVHICTSDSSGTCGNASLTATNIKIWTFGANTSLVSQNIDDTNASVRYQDSQCVKGQACEHIGHVDIKFGAASPVRYRCNHGRCNVLVG